ncbi:MAG: hypothetical protein CL840_07425 [Crocinitomicaceae bacterium]|nr:hypothetical protein [Crocinitomicaceae bacterium]|tara:strand:- start:16634 stop:17593 length:960 start_codon:yes stop_codon:yes gene_type:complete
MKKLLTILLALFMGFSASAQIERGLIIELDTQLILIGDQINMTVELRSHTADKITFPNLGDTLKKEVEVVSRELPDTSFKDGNLQQRIIRQQLVITSFDSGLYQIDPFVATINGDSAFSQPFMIGVFTFPIDSTNAIMDIKGNIQVPLTFMDYVKAYWHYVAAIYGLGTILLLLYFYFKNYRNKPKEEVVVAPTIPAHDLAMQRIINLEKKRLWQNGKFKEYHVRLSEIIREYLENRYNILALEQTTDEILNDLRPVRLENEIRANLEDLLKLMDLVKFAKFKPLDSENEAVLTWSKQIIAKTKLVEFSTEEMPEEDNS